MKLTQEVIDKIQEAMNHTKMNGDMNWLDGDEIEATRKEKYISKSYFINEIQSPCSRQIKRICI